VAWNKEAVVDAKHIFYFYYDLNIINE